MGTIAIRGQGWSGEDEVDCIDSRSAAAIVDLPEPGTPDRLIMMRRVGVEAWISRRRPMRLRRRDSVASNANALVVCVIAGRGGFAFC